MMKLIRWILGKIILSLDSLFSPRPLERSAEEQARLDRATHGLSLYQFVACPFCVKVRRAIRRLNLKIELRDAQNVQAYADELEREGGQRQVPCLRIVGKDGKVQWMYESSDIVRYLEREFGAGA